MRAKWLRSRSRTAVLLLQALPMHRPVAYGENTRTVYPSQTAELPLRSRTRRRDRQDGSDIGVEQALDPRMGYAVGST